ncbi:Crp/Fnr family transcriptional regulator [Candidatus Sumerlaeota bacterium]|nr:Crp/Fnr family transcriptional regulator [Candidatus Sumerlaeota bacterium]
MLPESPFFATYLDALKHSALFAGLSDETLATMLVDYRRETYPKGARLLPKQTMELFTVVITGRLELTRTSPESGRQMTLFLMEPGDGFDVISLLDGKEHDIDAVAVEALEVVTAPIGRVRHWMQANPDFNRGFLPYLGHRIRDLENLSADLVLSETVARLARLILLQATPEPLPIGSHEPPRLPLINTLSDEAMARMIGSVRVVVNRHIQDFKRLGLISKRHGKLIVTDLEKLHEFCERLP